MEAKTEKKTRISKDLVPVVASKRTTGGMGYFNMWIGLSIIIATFAVGGEGIQQMHLPVKETFFRR